MSRLFPSIFMLVVLLIGSSAMAANLETLVMPGKVISGHAKYEEECDRCHEAFSKKSQRRLCLDCHKKVAKDLASKSGLHGRDATIQKVECKQCHSDHLGRGADIVQFNRDSFNHDQTDFKLRDSHASISCNSCHKPDALYREAKAECYACHKREDVHKGKFGKKCGDCHQAESWRKHIFDHSKTKYPLTGKHKQTSCALCHIGNKYKGVSDKCNDCHRLNDIHNGKYSEKCQECHSTKGWKGYNFDHDKKTKFPLHGKHKKAACDSCHKNDDFKKELKRTCYSCHKPQDIHKGNLSRRCGDCHNESDWREHNFKHVRFKITPCYDCHKADDIHKGRYGKKCKECHNDSDWKKGRFDHNKETKFKLKGKHKDVMCVGCHKGEASKEKDKTRCIDCHTLDDVHKTKLGKKCHQCHNEDSWRAGVKFEHDLSRFPLVGLHATTPCEGCHQDNRYRETEKNCFGCHQQDDTHKRRLSEKCELCHNPNSWTFWQFNHDKQSKFKLKGAHKGIVCESCHRAPLKEKIELGKKCIDCHRLDDSHDGGFGNDCERCHNQKDFKEITLKR